MNYPIEDLNADYESDDGTIQDNVDYLAEQVVGHRIVKVEKDVPVGGRNYWRSSRATILTLDNGKQVRLFDTNDCCAYTELETFLLHADKIDHIITGVGTTEGATKWHIYADMGDVLELHVGWSSGNPFYYGYGFDIEVVEVEA